MTDSGFTIDPKDLNYDYRLGRLAAMIRVTADANSQTCEERIDSLIHALAIEYYEQYSILSNPEGLMDYFIDSVKECIQDVFSEPQYLLFEGYNGYLDSHGIEIISHSSSERSVCIEDFGGDPIGE